MPKNSLTQTPSNRLAYPESIGPVPRNEYLGALADFLAQSYSPERTQQMQGISQFLNVPAVSRTLDMMSYGEPLTTGSGGLGGTTRPKADVVEAALTVAPITPAAALQAARVARQTALAGGRVVGGAINEAMVYGRGPLASITPQPNRIFVPASTDEAIKASRMLKTMSPQDVWRKTGVGKFGGEYQKEISDQAARFNTAEDIAADAQKIRDRNVELKAIIKESQSTYPDLFPKELTAARRPLREEIKTNQNMLERNFGYEADPSWAGQLAEIAYEHPELYKAIPELKGVVIRQGRNAGDALRGSYEEPTKGGAGLLEITKKGLQEDPRSTATHEMQHAVQGLANWERGGSPDEFLRAAVKEREQINAKISDLNEKMKGAVNTPLYDDLMNERMMLVKELQSKGYDDMSSIGTKAYQQYERLAGEAQARLAQTRLNLTPEERRSYFPFQYGKGRFGLDVRPEDLIFRNAQGIESQNVLRESRKSASANEDQNMLSYRGSHKAPGPDFGAPLHDLTSGGQMYPADVYSPKAAQYYGTGYPKADKEAFALANRVRGNPNAEVTMYRAVPKDSSIGSINAGDWVTLSKDYAKNHGESVLDNDYKIISQKVKAKDLWTNADSIHEFGYHPEESLAKDKNQLRKGR